MVSVLQARFAVMKLWSQALVAAWEAVRLQIAAQRTLTVDVRPVKFVAMRHISLRGCVAAWELAWAHRAPMLFLTELAREQTMEKFVWKVRA